MVLVSRLGYLAVHEALYILRNCLALPKLLYRQVGLLCPILHVQMDAALEPVGVDQIFMAQKVSHSLYFTYHNL